MKLFYIYVIKLVLLLNATAISQNIAARIHYSGGGDWYGNRTTFSNIFEFLNKDKGYKLDTKEGEVTLKDNQIFKYPLLYISGHGNIKFSIDETENLRTYLLNGGFLWADDDYGMSKSFFREMKKVFPGITWQEVPFNHSIYNIVYSFKKGLPKIHEHDGGIPKGLGLFYNGKMIAFFTLNTDISDGCEDQEIHGDPPKKREEALKMAINIIIYAISQ